MEKNKNNIHLSVLTLTKNNEKTLEYNLKSIYKYADEIVILDSGSTDKTLEIARKYTDKILFRPFDGNFGEQKNYGMKNCTGEWIFILDSDEFVGENFSNCFSYLNGVYRSLALPRCHIFDIKKHQQLLTYTHYYDWQTRFIKNDGTIVYGDNRVHENLQNYRRRLHCCEAHIFHLDFLVKGYMKRKAKVEFYNRLANAGYPRMYLPEDYPYHTMSMMELPELELLHDLENDENFYQYPLRESKWISAREILKWKIRQTVTRARKFLNV